MESAYPSPLLSSRGKDFLLLSSLVFLGLLVLIVSTDKVTLFIDANFYHSRELNLIFENITFLGDGLFALLLCAALLISGKKNLPLGIFLTFLISGLFAQLIKNLAGAPRPMAMMGNSLYPYFIEGVTHSGWNSFPSGHTTTAFAIASMLALQLQGKIWCGLFFLLAVLVGYSRIYLGQHFVEDIAAGMVLGTGSTYLTDYLLQFRQKRKKIKSENARKLSNNKIVS